jgi:hypothetical protein
MTVTIVMIFELHFYVFFIFDRTVFVDSEINFACSFRLHKKCCVHLGGAIL